MTHVARLFWNMLRYRVAVMIWMFLLLGAAARDGLTGFDTRFVWAAVALGAAYVAATTTFLLQGFVVAIAVMLRDLWRADDPRAEQVAIGIGARMGNGLLITVLGVLTLRGQGAGAGERLLFAAALAAVFGASFLTLRSRPEEALIGYKA